MRKFKRKFYCSNKNCDFKDIIKNNYNLNYSKEFIGRKYTVKEFTDELIKEVSKYPESMYELNPARSLRYIKGFSMRDLSILWGYCNDYVSKKLRRKENNPEYILSDKVLCELKLKLKTKFGNMSNNCIDLIDAHQNGTLSLESLFHKIRDEIGRISEMIPVTLDELALIFGFSRGHIVRMRSNPDFVLDKERLKLLENNCQVLLKNNVENILKLISKYIEKNPNLPEYAYQQYNIENPYRFKNIFDTIEAMYWFGFLCADGYLTRDGHYRIVIKLQRSDREIIERFAIFVGLDLERIDDNISLFRNKKNELNVFENSIIRFGCKTMWQDLENLGIFQFKDDGELPNIVKSLIIEAKRKYPNGNLKDTLEGRLALNFLLGFYDGDGHWDNGMSAAIYNTKKHFLEQIKQYFNIPNVVRRVFKGINDEKTGEIIQKPLWNLYLGTDLFQEILSSFENSLQRKRPPFYRK